MLVLTRKIGERIHIGDKIVLVVVSIDGRRIKLGIEADKDIPVFRSELIKRKEQR
jgi:carbon storage regulator